MEDINKAPEIDFSTEFDGKELSLIQAIKLGDIDADEGLRNRLMDWLDVQAEIAGKVPSPMGQINYSLRRAKLFFQAGLYSEAFGEAMDARTYAEGMLPVIGKDGEKVIEEANGILLNVTERH